MRNKFNNLAPYIYEYSKKEYRKDVIDSIFRSVLDPVIEYKNVEFCILIRILDKGTKESAIKRLAFSNANIYSFSDILSDENLNNNQNENIWENTEFLIVLSSRYSVALIWDYTTGEIKNSSKICILFNSSVISNISKLIADNSKTNLKDIIKQFVPDRRENKLLNKAVQSITDLLNDKDEEYMFSENQKNSLENLHNKIQLAKIVTDKAKFISHEINNYLSIINIYSKILEKRILIINEQSEIKNSLINILGASENISYLINDLRCMSAPYNKEINLKELIINSVELCRAKLEKAQIKISLNKVKNDIIKTDKSKVQCAITNIIFNAIDANATKIFIETDNNRILIKNNGDEIPKEIQDKIFDENFTTKENGNGLGLYFCKKELQTAGGDLILVSSNKKSTIFSINL